MKSVDNPVLTLCLVVYRSANRVIVAEAHTRFNEDAVYLVTHDRDRRHIGYRKIIKSAHGGTAETAPWCLGQVVPLA